MVAKNIQVTWVKCRRSDGIGESASADTVVVQRETDIVHLRLIESLAFGKEVFLGMREFRLTMSRKCAGRPV